ncbi:MAG TPA: TRAP transporter small permease subunit [Nitrospira sp.]|nr:TRAP transporter small permease subunit [Nitrospira sp.]
MSEVSRRVERVAGWLSLVERYFTGTLLIAMTALYALNIFVRMVLPMYASKIAWIDEATRWMMIWVVFVAAGIALEVGRHVSVNIAHNYMPERLLSVVFKVIDVVGLVLALGVAYFSFNLAVFVAGTGQVSPTLGISTAILYVAPCIGFSLLALRYLLQVVGLRDMRRDPKRPAWLGSGLT